MKDHACSSFHDAMSRRTALKLSAVGLVPWMLSASALSQVKLGPKTRDHALVVLFLRGGSDGLNMLVPYADDQYYKARPSLAIARPNDGKVNAALRAEKLTDTFGLHPSLRPLKHWFEEGLMAITPAVGSQDRTRSHFEAMSAMERGAATGISGEPSGWLARYLKKTQSQEDTPLRAVAWANTMPDSLLGAASATVVSSIADFKLNADNEFIESLKELYEDPSHSLVASAGANTLDSLKKIEELNPAAYQTSGGKAYPANAIGNGFKEVACLLKSGLDLEIACLEDTGWDTHFAQGGAEGIHARGLAAVAESIDAFLADLGDRAKKITLIVMTEFGRTVNENASLGTDHGRASVFMAFGDVDGGKIHGKWPGLGGDQLDGNRDLVPANDYRQVLTGYLAPKMPEIANIWI